VSSPPSTYENQEPPSPPASRLGPLPSLGLRQLFARPPAIRPGTSPASMERLGIGGPGEGSEALCGHLRKVPSTAPSGRISGRPMGEDHQAYAGAGEDRRPGPGIHLGLFANPRLEPRRGAKTLKQPLPQNFCHRYTQINADGLSLKISKILAF